MNEREECKCGPYYDCEEHDTDPVRSRDKWRQRALAAEPLAADRAALAAQLAAAERDIVGLRCIVNCMRDNVVRVAALLEQDHPHAGLFACELRGIANTRRA